MILVFLCYQVLQIASLPFLLLYLFIRILKKKPTIGNLKERLGFVPKAKRNKKTIWIHAVSVGEILSIQNISKQIKENISNASCYVTCGTVSGKRIAQKNIKADQISFLPYDFLFSMLLAFKRIKPSAIIIIEAETWPNLLMLTKCFNIPIYNLNARMSNHSKNKYHRFKFFLQPLINRFHTIFVQSEQDQKNFEHFGISKEKISLLGNIKTFNVLYKKNALICITQKPYHALLLGSLHPGELDLHLTTYNTLKQEFPKLKLIIAPRHFHWKQELIEKIKRSKHPYLLWEKETVDNLEDFIKKTFDTHDILLVCKLGELFKLYQYADIFFLGGTFVPIGGHNLLEPAVFAKPSIIGPYYKNCIDIANKLENNKALIKTKNQQELLKHTRTLLNNKKAMHTMGKNAYEWLLKEADFVQKNLEVLFGKLQ
jgi:3-deoxy-D-manno-octulosonic-acid transferase